MIQLTDPLIHAWLGGPEVARSLAWLARSAAVMLGPQYRDDAVWALHHAGRDAEIAPGGVLEALYRVSPVNLAERIHEGLNLYWYVGSRSLPPLLDMVGPMVQAELHLYTRLAGGGKPYRDHIVHMTRVAGLAHLVLTRPDRLGLPAALHWDTLRHRWPHTPELHLLREHAARRGLDLPDPAGDDDPWRQVVRSAALLAGLLHDLGYLHKAIGEVAERAVRAVPWMTFQPVVELPFKLGETPLGALCRATIDTTRHGQLYASLPELLRRHYRDLHSLVGALWLLGLVAEEPSGDEREDERLARSQAELSVHLATMMAFAHDLALSDGERRSQLGLRKGTGRDVLDLDDFPLCTLFALSDVLQEFGRSLQVVDGEAIRHVVPMPAIGLVPAGRSLRVHYLVRTLSGRKSELWTARTRRLLKGSDWDESRVGDKVEPWLAAAGLGDLVEIAGRGAYDPTAACPPELGAPLVW